MIEVYKFFNTVYDSVTTGWLTDRHIQTNYVMKNCQRIVFINLRFDIYI